MKTIKVFEYSSLKINEDFTKDHFDKLVIYNEKHKNKFFTIRHHSISFKSYVGILQVGNLAIEILPKADQSNKESDTNKWHNALIQLLHFCEYLNVDSLDKANLKIKSYNLIDLFYNIFINEVKTLAHQGLLKKYHSHIENKNVLKGRLLFNQHITRNYINKEKFYTCSQVYDCNNPFNQILYKALLILKNNNRRFNSNDDIRNLLPYFDNVDLTVVCPSLLKQLKYTRNTLRYKTAIIIAQFIINNESPDFKSGNSPVISLLFDMNMLYERAVYKLLKLQEPYYKNYQLKLSSQSSEKFWGQHFIRPDILGEYISEGDRKPKHFIIDTKWKILHNFKPDSHDLKQMFTYNVHFGSHSSILLYPHHKDSFQCSHFFEKSISIKPIFEQHNCSIFFINIFDHEGNIKKDSGKELLKSLIQPHAIHQL